MAYLPPSPLTRERFQYIISVLVEYFQSLVTVNDQSGVHTIIDPDTALPATCCTQSQVAALFALDHALHARGNGALADRLVEDVRRRQNANGSFSSSYNQPVENPDLQDVAEIGASANALFYVHQINGVPEAKEALEASAEYLLTQVAEENPGAIYKNAEAKHLNILNGDVYAALTLSRAFELSGDDRFLKQATTIVDHVIARFGAWREGWWPYAETWDGEVAVGASVAYQSTIIAFGKPICRILPPEGSADWDSALKRALHMVTNTLPLGPSDDTEVPTWSREWAQVWEIPLAYLKFSESEHARSVVLERLNEVHTGFHERGIDALRPNSLQKTGHTPVTSLYRKAATFAGFISDVIMTWDEIFVLNQLANEKVQQL